MDLYARILVLFVQTCMAVIIGCVAWIWIKTLKANETIVVPNLMFWNR